MPHVDVILSHADNETALRTYAHIVSYMERGLIGEMRLFGQGQEYMLMPSYALFLQMALFFALGVVVGGFACSDPDKVLCVQVKEEEPLEDPLLFKV